MELRINCFRINRSQPVYASRIKMKSSTEPIPTIYNVHRQLSSAEMKSIEGKKVWKGKRLE